MCWEDRLYLGRLWFRSLPGCGHTGLDSWQNSLFEDPHLADLHPSESPGLSAPLTQFCRWAQLLFGINSLGAAGVSLACRGPCAGGYLLLLTSLLQSDSPAVFSWIEMSGGGFCKAAHIVSEGRLSPRPWVLRSLEEFGDLSTGCSVAWSGCRATSMSLLLLPSSETCLPCWAGSASASVLYLWFSQWWMK